MLFAMFEKLHIRPLVSACGGELRFN